MITQQYLYDPLTPEQRARLEERIALTERMHDELSQQLLASLIEERDACVPRLVHYDPRVHQ
jgi:hypothetical protein